MKRFSLLLVIGTILTLLTGCDVFNKVSEETQKTVGGVKNAVDQTIKTTTNTVNTGVKKVEDVTNAVGALQKSVNDLSNWQTNSNKNTNSNNTKK
jgi:DNA anti-recombination protein RmuC